nr:hypothetical protein L204_05482 [Cryptococcus depauperatus CBS 7855]
MAKLSTIQNMPPLQKFSSIPNFFESLKKDINKVPPEDLFATYQFLPYTWSKDKQGKLEFYAATATPSRTMHSEHCAAPPQGDVVLHYDPYYFRDNMLFSDQLEKLEITRNLIKTLVENKAQVPTDLCPIYSEYHFNRFLKYAIFSDLNIILQRTLHKGGRYTKMAFSQVLRNKNEKPDWLLVMDSVAVAVVIVRSPLTLPNFVMNHVMELFKHKQCTVAADMKGKVCVNTNEEFDGTDKMLQAKRSMAETFAALLTHNVTTACLYNYDMAFIIRLLMSEQDGSFSLHCSPPTYRDLKNAELWEDCLSPTDDNGTLLKEYDGVATTFHTLLGLACRLAQPISKNDAKSKKKKEKRRNIRNRYENNKTINLTENETNIIEGKNNVENGKEDNSTIQKNDPQYLNRDNIQHSNGDQAMPQISLPKMEPTAAATIMPHGNQPQVQSDAINIANHRIQYSSN